MLTQLTASAYVIICSIDECISRKIDLDMVMYSVSKCYSSYILAFVHTVFYDIVFKTIIRLINKTSFKQVRHIRSGNYAISSQSYL